MLLLLLIQNHVLTVIVETKPRACLMALLTKIMRCILQIRAQEQPQHITLAINCDWSLLSGNTHWKAGT